MRSGVWLFMSAALAASNVYAAQGVYPDRPIRLIVPYPPGGNIDITARTIGPGLGEALGAQIVVDNRGGAGGTIGSEMAAKAPPDGYTLLLGSTGTLATAQALYPRLQFEPLKDFAYTSLVSSVALVVEVIPTLPARNVKELVALLKSRPGRVTFASSGIGTSNHLTGEYFQTVTGTKLTHVPFKGSGPALVDLMGGQVDMMFDQVSSSVGYIKSGKIRALAVATLKRTNVLSDVPTMDESGYKGFEARTLTCVLLPAKTPPDIVKRVYAAVVKVLRTPATREAFARVGADVIESTPEELDRLMKAENVKWTKVIRDAHVKVE
ncbi:MAG TPA: tripartite tricarboxylate transporter substrate binding protein [Burkholderiales bacterium]|nr:tripartite tricarboxylate transporter substrate binding protein [Burkholderiales bacterium]